MLLKRKARCIMANAKASTTGQITVVSNGTTFYTVIQCQLGDLYQTYLGDADAPTNIAPDFEASGVTKPVLVFLTYSSEVGSGNGLASIENANMHWFIGTTEILFDSQGVSKNTFGGETGHFTKTTQQIGDAESGYVKVQALQVNKNLVKVNGCNSFLIRGEADVSVVNSSVKLSSAYQVSITLGTENTKKVTIVAGDTNYFTIRTKSGTCKLRAQVDNKSAAGLGYTFKWYIEEGGAWSLQTETSDVFTILESQVNSSALVKVEVYKNDDLYGQDVQTVNDASDPYNIHANPCDENGFPTVEQFTRGDGKTIYYKPILWYNDNGVRNTVKNQKFKMWIYDNAGVSLQKFETPAETFEVTSEMIVGHGGATYIIQTSD